MRSLRLDKLHLGVNGFGILSQRYEFFRNRLRKPAQRSEQERGGGRDGGGMGIG